MFKAYYLEGQGDLVNTRITAISTIVIPLIVILFHFVLHYFYILMLFLKAR